jgi:hypothetical protein
MLHLLCYTLASVDPACSSIRSRGKRILSQTTNDSMIAATTVSGTSKYRAVRNSVQTNPTSVPPPSLAAAHAQVSVVA